MSRCTWSDGRGNWGIRGVDLATLPPSVYGALYKLHNMERLTDEIRREMNAKIAEPHRQQGPDAVPALSGRTACVGGVSMERLTVRTPAGFANLDYPQNTYYQDGTKDQIATSAFRQQAIERLAAYEDICFDEDGKERITVEELSALVKARGEGRVVVLPCKRGDEVRATVKRPYNGHTAEINGIVSDIQTVEK